MATASFQDSVNATSGNLYGLSQSKIEVLCEAFGIDANPTCELERADIGFLQVQAPKSHPTFEEILQTNLSCASGDVEATHRLDRNSKRNRCAVDA